MKYSRVVGFIILAIVASACGTSLPQVTPTVAPTSSPTPESTDVAIVPSPTPVIELTETPTLSPVPTQPSPTDTPTPTLTFTPTETPTATSTSTPIPTPTLTFTPSVTPTGTLTPSATPSDTSTPTHTPTSTATFTLTFTPVPTNTLTSTPTPSLTNTPEPSPTPILTNTPLPTATATQTLTPTSTSTRTFTPLPTITPTETPTATNTPLPTETFTPFPSATFTLTLTPLPTITPTATLTPTNTTLPTFTSVPTLNETEIARLLGTREPDPNAQPTWTPFGQASPTNTVSVATIPATPTFITATPGGDSGILNTPTPSTPEVQFDAPTTTFTPLPTLFQPTVAVNPDLLVTPIAPPSNSQSSFSVNGAGAYQYNVGIGQVFTFNAIQLSGGVALFAPNPVDSNSFMRTDPNGMLSFRPIGASGEGVMTFSPFFDGFAANGSLNNKNRVVELDWSADGQRLSFRINPPPGLDNGAAGVWFWQSDIAGQTDPTYQIIRDCVEPGYEPCNFVNGSNAAHWKTIGVEWSPQQGSYNVLLNVRLPDENRNALAMTQAVRDSNYAAQAPEFFRYDYGYWLDDGQRIIVSGRRPDGQVIIGYVNSALTGEQVIFNASAAGLWVQNAVQRPNGQIVALGRPGSPFDNAPVSLYDSNGIPLSAPIGAVAPEDVRWYPDRSAVVVSVQGRQYTVRVDDGSVTDTTDLASNPTFGSGGVGTPSVPQGIIAGSEYSPGQQLRVLSTNLNIRQDPSTGSLILGGLVQGDYVAAIAGPYDNEGFRWWKVQTAGNIVGWVAGTINNTLTLSP